MSFFQNTTQECCCQDRVANANGPCEKICVELKRVFDACQKQGTLENVLISVKDQNPETPTDPLKFTSASALGRTKLKNLTVTQLKDKPCYARVQADAVIDMQVKYQDANCCNGEGTAKVVIPIDVVLCVPQASILPYDISAVSGLVSPSGSYEGENTFRVTICYTLIVKVTMDVEIVVPTYGYCTIPQCQDFNEEVCTDFFELPLYPSLSSK